MWAKQTDVLDLLEVFEDFFKPQGKQKSDLSFRDVLFIQFNEYFGAFHNPARSTCYQSNVVYPSLHYFLIHPFTISENPQAGNHSFETGFKKFKCMGIC